MSLSEAPAEDGPSTHPSHALILKVRVRRGWSYFPHLHPRHVPGNNTAAAALPCESCDEMTGFHRALSPTTVGSQILAHKLNHLSGLWGPQRKQPGTPPMEPHMPLQQGADLTARGADHLEGELGSRGLQPADSPGQGHATPHRPAWGHSCGRAAWEMSQRACGMASALARHSEVARVKPQLPLPLPHCPTAPTFPGTPGRTQWGPFPKH